MLKLKQKYDWEKQENNRYRIKNIPVFRCFEDEKRGKVDAAIAKEIVHNFNKDAEGGYYPRTHIGHQDLESFDNRPGVGFMDNLRFDGKNFFIDIAEVSEDVFRDLQNYKYPYRSVEYNPVDKKIEGLALLESVPPYFNFPILALREQEHFSKNNKNNYLVLFQEQNMPEDFVEETEVEEGYPELENDDLAEEPAIDELEEIKTAWPAIQKMLEFFEDFKEEEMQEPEHQDTLGEEEPMAEPVAMQKFMKYIDEKFQKIDDKIEKFEKKRQSLDIDEELQSIANNNPNINFEAEKKFIAQFSSNRDKKLYIKKLKMQNSSFPEHSITQFAKNFTYEPQNKVLEKFQKENRDIQSVAKRAYTDYQDSINQRDEKRAMAFSKQFPTAEKYVNFAVEQEKMNPGSYNPRYINN